eukprot:470770-Pleurochrysis_carterae.AAC.1
MEMLPSGVRRTAAGGVCAQCARVGGNEGGGVAYAEGCTLVVCVDTLTRAGGERHCEDSAMTAEACARWQRRPPRQPRWRRDRDGVDTAGDVGVGKSTNGGGDGACGCESWAAAAAATNMTKMAAHVARRNAASRAHQRSPLRIRQPRTASAAALHS